MAKTVLIEGVLHRWRRGKLVPIPTKWIGKLPSSRRINARPSKQSHKASRRDKWAWKYKSPTNMYRKDKQSRHDARELAKGRSD